MKRTKTSIEEWKELGLLSKEIDRKLHELILKSSKIVGTTRSDSLKRSRTHLNKFRSKAEDLMFSQGEGDVDVFYGDKK